MPSATFSAPEARPARVLGRVSPGRGRQVLLLLLAAALSGVTILWQIQPHDEGLMLQAGARIANGQWPYRDFWTNYPPGQPLVVAVLQTVFGPSLLAWRVLRTATDAIVALLAYRLARRHAPEAYALGAWLAVAGAMAFPTGPGPNPSALALALAAVLTAGRRPSLAGALAGLTCLFRLEIGIAAIICVQLEAPRGTHVRAAVAALACAVATLVPFFVVAPAAMLHDTVGFYPIQGLQRLPFPLHFSGPVRPSKLIEFYIPLILVAGLMLWALTAALGLSATAPRRIARRAGNAVRMPSFDRAAISLAPLALVGFAYLFGRADEFHLVPLAAVLPVMLATGAAAAPARALRYVLLIVLALIALHGLDRRAAQLLHPPVLAAVPGPSGDGVQTDVADARSLRSLELTLAGLTHPHEAIFVANPRHDLVQAGDPLLYVILDHPNATRYDVMQPGVVTTAPVQREIVSSLARSRTRVVVRWLDPRASFAEPNGSGRSSGVHILDRYLASRFRPYARFGVYQVLVRSRTAAAGSR